jgi:ParB-like chromosome segregation protein Spo0J
MIDLPVSHIFMRPGARKINDQAVNGLMESIREIGIINPLRVRAARKMVDGIEADAYEVIAGGHRLRAARKLGLETVPCTVVHDDDLHAELAAIDENLCRTDLRPAERAQATARRKVIYETLHPEKSHGAVGRHHLQSRQVGDSENTSENKPVDRFTAETAKTTGKSERAIQRDADRGKHIADDVLELVKDTHLDTGKYLDDLKKIPAEEQREKVARALASEERKRAKGLQVSKAKADAKARAAMAIAAIISEHVPSDICRAMIDPLTSTDTKRIADALRLRLAISSLGSLRRMMAEDGNNMPDPRPHSTGATVPGLKI